MSDLFDQSFSKIDFTSEPLPAKEFDNCTFSSCNFSEVNLSGVVFQECTFTDCNLSNVKLAKTAFKDCKFKNCKLLGMHFEQCNEFLFEVSFEGCIQDHSTFNRLRLKKMKFIKCSLRECDFTEADLSESAFVECDLADARFERTNLEKADFTTAINYSLDPEINRLKKAKFSLDGVPGLLAKYQIQIS